LKSNAAVDVKFVSVTTAHAPSKTSFHAKTQSRKGFASFALKALAPLRENKNGALKDRGTTAVVL
jgi:hypothetical protein